MINRIMSRYLVLAYYDFTPIANPHEEVITHKNFFYGRDVTSRIYISETGINGQLSGAESDVQAYIEWMHGRPEFHHVVFKIHHYHENVFPRLTIKYRKQLVAIDETTDLANRGTHLSPEQWKAMIERAKNAEEEVDRPVLIDVRNDYEWQVGHFEGAELPPCETFRQFSDYADKLKEEKDPEKTPVMMYCTGGIRCELYSSILMSKGFKEVYQLDGGIINYGLKEGSKHWLGKLFVFDDRLTVPISDEPAEVIGRCHHCETPCEAYYNCANMDCNHLFLCCENCLPKVIGCCQETCQTAPRLRAYQQQGPHKPFRRMHEL
jgi:UPF0176 protein